MRRVAVRVHLLMCRRCRAFIRQLQVIAAAARGRATEDDAGRDFESRLLSRLRDKERP